MVDITEIIYTNLFENEVRRIREASIKDRLAKLVEKITSNPNIGKPLRFGLKGEKTIYLKPYRLIYAVDGSKLILLRFEHRKDVYKD